MVGAGFYVREVQETNDHDDGQYTEVCEYTLKNRELTLKV